ncbi:MAG: DNA alkylation repair protein [Candidatus Promineifilaceae bacterium]|nr:DNA alkylation repair protein [Candidatus Promineifilaceae bacterium]
MARGMVLMNEYIIPLKKLYEAHADPQTAGPMARYMRDKFEFLGIKTPQRKALFKQFLAENGLPPAEELERVIRDLWHLPQREYQYSGQALLEKMKRTVTPDHVPLLEYLVVTKSWWDTVDALASHQVGDFMLRYPDRRDPILMKWRSAEDFWLRRTTLLFQLRYKDNTDVGLLFELINENLGSKEFFINKAIGWALREYSKTDADAVIRFVRQTPLEPLSEREALKWVKNKGIL